MEASCLIDKHANMAQHQPSKDSEERGNSSGKQEGRTRLRVGCALLPKKVSRYLTPQMKSFALSQGVELALIDYRKSLHEQGPFDAIIHKLRPNKEWERNLLDYCKTHPDVAIIDSVDGIRTLQNRSTMLSPLHGEGVVIQDEHDGQPVRIQAPHQIEIPEGTTLAQAQQLLDDAGLHPPLLVKPLWTDGREGSHGLAVLHEMQSLERLLSGKVSSELQPPLVVQQFVEHGGVLFKVYVLGDRTVVSMRPSLGDKHLGHAARAGVLPLPRISCKSATDLVSVGQDNGSQGAITASLSHACSGPQTASHTPEPTRYKHARSSSLLGQTSDISSNEGSGHLAHECSGVLDGTQSPPEWVTHALAGVLRERLGMQLFNFDLICPSDTQQQMQLESSQHHEDGVDADHHNNHSALMHDGADPHQGQERREWLFYVVDVNYFPGVDKIPNFEQMFVAFLKDACAGWSARQASGKDGKSTTAQQNTNGTAPAS